MATVIRYARFGTKKKPFYRIVVQDKTAPRDGRFIDRIGTFDPLQGDGSLVLASEKLTYWISKGAQMSEAVKNQVKKSRKLGTVKEPVTKASAAAARKEAAV
jgi:small subunit ribosomal protein S16